MKVYRRSFYIAKQKDSGTEGDDLKRGMSVCGWRRLIACDIKWGKGRKRITHERRIFNIHELRPNNLPLTK
jgi:hypothetical protein